MSIRRTSARTGTARRLLLEALEDRVVPAVTIEINYSMDAVANGGSGFFQNNPAAVTVMNAVAEQMGERISANLAAIAPSGSNTWTAYLYSPETGNLITEVNIDVPANTVIVYVGAHTMSGGTVGYGGIGGFGWSGASAFGNTVMNRDWSGFVADEGGIWGGSIQFATNANWYFGLNPAALGSNQVDFYSVATHELGHALGVGTSQQWKTMVQGTSFYGPHAEAVYGGPVPLNGTSDLGEWANGLTIDGQSPSEGPSINLGQRIVWTTLDQAALEDIGWGAGATVPPPVAPVSPPPPTTSPPATSPPPVTTSPPPVTTSPPPPATTNPSSTAVPVLAGITNAGVVTEVEVTYSNGATDTWDPFGTNFTAGGTVALGDVTGSGYPDIIVSSGDSGTAGTILVYDGETRTLVATYHPLGSFGGGLDVAVGDVTGSGHDDIVVGVLSGGSPVVTVLNGTNGQVIDQFLAYSSSFLGGVRVAAGDVTGGGDADVVVAPGTGQQGLPVKVYSGASVATGTSAPQLLGGFVPFGAGYTGAVGVSVGNLTSTSYADIVVSTQSSGNYFRIYAGNTISSTSSPTPIITQSPWSTLDNTGVGVAFVSDAANNGYDDLIVTNGTGTRTARYLESQVTASGWPASDAEFFTPFPSVKSGVYVG